MKRDYPHLMFDGDNCEIHFSEHFATIIPISMASRLKTLLDNSFVPHPDAKPNMTEEDIINGFGRAFFPETKS
jgi:hypothetical protein